MEILAHQTPTHPANLLVKRQPMKTADIFMSVGNVWNMEVQHLNKFQQERLLHIVDKLLEYKNKIEEFNGLIHIFNPDFIFGTESWLDETILNSEIFPPTYDVYRKDRNCHGGGVFLLANKSSNGMLIDVETEHVESVWCRIRTPNKSEMAVGVFCRPPGSTAETISVLNNILSGLAGEQILIAGDFNLP